MPEETNKIKAANLRILAAQQRQNAAAHRRQAQKPTYAGQAAICEEKAAQLDAFAARSEAQAEALEEETMDLNLRGIPEQLVAEAKKAAIDAGQTLKAWVQAAITEKLEKSKK